MEDIKLKLSCVEELVADEEEAIDGYLAAKEKLANDEFACSLFDLIAAEEKRHIELLRAFATGTIDTKMFKKRTSEDTDTASNFLSTFDTLSRIQ